VETLLLVTCPKPMPGVSKLASMQTQETPSKISKDELILVVVHSLQPNQNKPVGQCQPRPTWAWKCPQSPEKTQSSFFGRTASIEFRL